MPGGGKLGALTVASDVVDYNITVAPTPGGIAIDTVKIGGSIRGDRGFGGGIFTNGSIGLVQVGQDIRGGTGTFSSVLSIDGNVGSLSIGGSLVGGAGIGSGSVFVSGTLGATQIGGDIDGGKILAGAAIKSLAVTGSVLRGQVLAGYIGLDAPFNGDATIGAVTVGGDWVASDLVAGAQTTDPLFGNGAEKLIAGGDPAKIALVKSIAIKGQAIGTPGGSDHFGFIAEEIGSFTVGGTKFPLADGAANDLAGFYVGSTLDAKVREVNATAAVIDPPLGGGGGGGGGTGFEIPLSSLDGTNGFEFALTDPVGDGARAVDAAGDVNNDGFMDFIVSARGASPGGVQLAGEAYVVFGKGGGFPPSFDANALDGTNGFRIQGNVASAQVGVGAGGAGDFNNDGFDDVIVGAIDLKGLSGSDTSAYVIFGKASFAATPAISVGTLNGSNGVELRAPHDSDTGVGFRMGVSSADINNDGFDDAIVGVVNADSTGSASGAVFVVFGRANSAATLIDMGALNGSDGFRFDSDGLNERIGGEVSAAGDISGDGIDDIVIGGAYAAGMNKRGQAYVVFGKTTAFAPNFGPSALNGTTGFRISGESNYGVLGLSVDAAGDVNGDGFGDVVVGAPYASITGEFSGATYVIYGKKTSVSGPFPTDIAVTTLNGTNGFRLVGEGEYDYAGRVAGVGDVNGDGFDDIGIGAIGAGTPDKFRGNAYVVFGRPTSPASIDLAGLTVSSGIKFIGVADQDQTGASIAGVGDVNNDGIDDLLIGAPKANATSTSNIPGAAYLVFGTQVGATFPATFSISSLNGSNGFTIAPNGVGRVFDVASAGDVNGDGFDDAIVGAPQATVNGNAHGAAFVVFGHGGGFTTPLNLTALDGTNGFRIDTPTMGELFGQSVHGAGDVNNDGFDDLIIGSTDTAFVVFGKATGFDPIFNVSTLNGSNGFALTTTSSASDLHVSTAGDVNNDGFADVIVGAPEETSAAGITGAAFVFFGKASGFAASTALSSLNGSAGFRVDGVSVSDDAGHSVSGGGDLNGDGLDDVIIGSYTDDPASTRSRSAAYVVFGKASGFTNLNASALNGANGFAFRDTTYYADNAIEVSHAGDVNGDGFDDLIMGNFTGAPNGIQSGVSYVVFGHTGAFTASLDATALNGSNGFTMNGEAQFHYSGAAVAGIGDVNGDGFDDVAVGAYGDATPNGITYVIYGHTGAFTATLPLSALNGANGFRITSMDDAGELGRNLSRAGDMNGDGTDDFLIGQGFGTSNSHVIFGRGPGNGSGGGGGGGVLQPLSFSPDNKTAFFTDVDGDRVSVKTSLGTFDGSEFTRAAVAGFNGAQLQKLKLGAAFAGASITVTAVRGPDGGDGFVNVGHLDARTIDVGAVTIDGDLGHLDAGDGTPLKQAVTSLTVQSLGRLGLSTQAAAGASLESNIAGKLGKLTVKSDVVGAFLNVSGSVNDDSDDTGAINIGGMLRGGATANSGAIFAGDDIVSVKIGQGIIGGAGAYSGSIESGGKIGNVTLGNSLLGGSGAVTGSLISASTLGVTIIGGDLSGRIFAKGNLLPTTNALALAIKDLTVNGSVLNADIFAGYDRTGAPVNADAQIGDVIVRRDWIASDLVAGMRPIDAFFGNGDELISGGNAIVAKIASILVNGQALGTMSGADHFGFVAQQIGSFTIAATSLKLTAGPSNDLAGLPVGATFDLRVREL